MSGEIEEIRGLHLLLWSEENRVDEYKCRLTYTKTLLCEEQSLLTKMKSAEREETERKISDLVYQIQYFTGQIASRSEEIQHLKVKIGLSTSDNSWTGWGRSLVARFGLW